MLDTIDVGLISFITLIIGFMCGFLFGFIFTVQSIGDIIDGLINFVYARKNAGIDEEPTLEDE